MNLKIVKFKNGKYGVRRLTVYGYEFLDLKNDDILWLDQCSRWYKSLCQTTLEKAKEGFDRFTDNGKPVKFIEPKRKNDV